jgi:hypothetical protein
MRWDYLQGRRIQKTSLGLFENLYLEFFWEIADIPAGTRKSGFRMEEKCFNSCGISDLTRRLSTKACACESVRIGLRQFSLQPAELNNYWVCLCKTCEPPFCKMELRSVPRNSHNSGNNDTVLKTFILFVQCVVNWCANLAPTNAQFSIQGVS